jgi:hypothetical protein
MPGQSADAVLQEQYAFNFAQAKAAPLQMIPPSLRLAAPLVTVKLLVKIP